MTHQQVIERFINGAGARGTNIHAKDGRLYSRIPDRFNRWGSRTSGDGPTTLAVRLQDGGILVNGAQMNWPIAGHQTNVLHTLDQADARFSVIPFHSIVAALTDGKQQTWSEGLIPIEQVQKEVRVVVPSEGEHWKEVTEKDDRGIE